jgi:hypothetical protein
MRGPVLQSVTVNPAGFAQFAAQCVHRRAGNHGASDNIKEEKRHDENPPKKRKLEQRILSLLLQ